MCKTSNQTTKVEDHPEPTKTSSTNDNEVDVDEMAEQTELTRLTEQEQRVYRDLKRINHIMDNAFEVPVIHKRIGIDPLIGLLPGIGDVAAAIVSLIFVWRASMVMKKRTTCHMICNILIDMVIGSIPIVGDAFDFYFKCNQRNLKLFERRMHASPDTNATMKKKKKTKVEHGSGEEDYDV